MAILTVIIQGLAKLLYNGRGKRIRNSGPCLPKRAASPESSMNPFFYPPDTSEQTWNIVGFSANEVAPERTAFVPEAYGLEVEA
jgi:hypothetical protein